MQSNGRPTSAPEVYVPPQQPQTAHSALWKMWRSARHHSERLHTMRDEREVAHTLIHLSEDIRVG